MNELVGFIYNSGVSQWLRMTTWAIPLVQTIHLLALAALMGSAILLNARLAGLLARADRAAALVSRYQRVIYYALVVMLVSGAVLAWAEPDRVVLKSIFWIKLGLVAVGLAITFAVAKALVRQEQSQQPASTDWLLGAFGLLVWIAAIFCGRFIAYIY